MSGYSKYLHVQETVNSCKFTSKIIKNVAPSRILPLLSTIRYYQRAQPVTYGNSAAKSWETAILHELYLSTIAWVPVLFLFSHNQPANPIEMSSNLVNYKSTSSLHRNFDWLGSHWISFISLCYCHISK